MAAQAKKIDPKTNRGSTGRLGEDLAAKFLADRGFRLIVRNWRCRLGEIDLIVERRGRIHFIEVKTRRGTSFGFPEEAVGFTKRQRWFRAIELWLQTHAPTLQSYQADVVSILLGAAEPQIEWIENVAQN
jgi:putative endonuclease